MSDGDDIAYVDALLTAARIAADRVRESTVEGENRCDLHAHDDHGEEYLLEVKGIHEEAAMATALQNEGIYSASKPISESNTITVILDKAVKQLRMTAESGHAGTRIAVLIGRGTLSNKVIQDRIFATLYGLRTIAELKVPVGSSHKCLYFSHSAFFRHRNYLDAVVIMDDKGAGMCLNDFGSRIRRVRDSRLGRFFGEANLLHDAERIERDGHFLIADCDVDRNDEHGVLQYLATKYNLTRPTVMQSYGFVGAVSLIQPPS